jgi:hypothetical protein
MIRLYSGSGSGDMELIGPALPQEDWDHLRRSVCSLLRARHLEEAADTLESVPFELCDARNFFGDEFTVLHASLPLDQYVKLAEQAEKAVGKATFRTIAETTSEIGPYVRFVAAELDTKSHIELVAMPIFSVTSDAVERALADCEQLINTRGATSGVDRVHTAFHGYLRVACDKAGIVAPQDASITGLFKLLRTEHPNIIETAASTRDIGRVLLSMATIVDSLNPLRNSATLAHPNEALLEEAEAMLVINSVRTLLHYLNAKLG